MTDRYKSVTEPFHKTLNWIFHDASAQLPWDCFTDWLDRGSGVYWVNGKAGSGKSTLMRYLYDDPRMKQHLTSWAKDTPLHQVSSGEFPAFLHFAVQFGLFEYVVERTKEMKQDGRLRLNRRQAQSFANAKRTLLYYAVSPVRDSQHRRLPFDYIVPSELRYIFPCRPEVVALLLDLGGNPNEVTNGTTIWKHALQGVTWC
jgi:hypothetical protein